MSMSRFFSLGDGIDTLTGEHKARGIIKKENKDVPHFSSKTGPTTPPEGATEDEEKEKKEAIPKAPVSTVFGNFDDEINDTKYEVFVVKTYNDLSRALGIKSSLTAPLHPGVTVSAESEIFSKTTLYNRTASCPCF